MGTRRQALVPDDTANLELFLVTHFWRKIPRSAQEAILLLAWSQLDEETQNEMEGQ